MKVVFPIEQKAEPKGSAGQDAHLAEKKLMLRIPLGRASVRQAHTLFHLSEYPA